MLNPTYRLFISGIALFIFGLSCKPVKQISLLSDPRFEKGLALKRASTPSPGNLYPFGSRTDSPFWELAEWGSRFELRDSVRQLETDGTVTYANEGKILSFRRTDRGVTLNMEVYASREYDLPRQPNQGWPHLLLEQEFQEKPFLKDLQSLILKFKGRLTRAEMRMDTGDFNPGLHTAQFQLFLTIQNRNAASPHFGDYLWFGIPLYDYRYSQIPLYAAQDVGKGDATGKFIYSVGSQELGVPSFRPGEWVSLGQDVYPHILTALETAWARGYLQGSAFDEFQISGMNLGWEVPGTFDVGFEFTDFDLIAVAND